jgi:hypothetical protein
MWKNGAKDAGPSSASTRMDDSHRDSSEVRLVHERSTYSLDLDFDCIETAGLSTKFGLESSAMGRKVICDSCKNGAKSNSTECALELGIKTLPRTLD